MRFDPRHLTRALSAFLIGVALVAPARAQFGGGSEPIPPTAELV